MSFVTRLLPEEQHRIPLLFLLVLSYVTIVHGFWNPQALFWDENYHIASAQKYLNGVFFMEPHPPLGKLVIAAGEALLDLNETDDQFIGTDYATNPPAGFNFTGYRLFPTLLAWLSIPLLYAIFFVFTRKPLWAMMLSFLAVLDNAGIVHNRSAMLETTMLFFSLLTILSFLLVIRAKDNDQIKKWGMLFGVAFGAALATKVFTLLFILLIPLVAWRYRDNLTKFARFGIAAGLSFLIVYCGIWYIHFARGRTVVPALPDAGYYQSSDRSIAIIDAGKTASPLAFPFLFADAHNFVSHYEAGVPSLDLCKEDENGSPWFLWPIGARTISYRWATPDSYSYQYLYLVPNPVAWGAGLLALILGLILWTGSYVLPLAKRPALHFELGTFLLLYVCYMAAVSRIDRVMYLYHYFLPLTFSFILVGIVWVSLEQLGPWKLTEKMKSIALLVLSVLVFLSFEVYRPFTYYEPITDDAVTKRALLKLWDLHCTECAAPNVLGTPVPTAPNS